MAVALQRTAQAISFHHSLGVCAVAQDITVYGDVILRRALHARQPSSSLRRRRCVLAYTLDLAAVSGAGMQACKPVHLGHAAVR